MDKKSQGIFNRPFNRRDALKMLGKTTAAGVVLSAIPGVGIAAMKTPTERPNLIFILGDNHNAETMEFAGHPFIKTPGFNRLAREGVHLQNTFNTTSLCTPSRASILTGAYCHKHGVKNNHMPWTDSMPTFLEHLSKNDYATAFIGKWHMPGDGLPKFPYLDLFVSYTYREGQGTYFNCPMIVNGEEVASRKPYITEEVTDYAIDFMKSTLNKPESERKPFCIYLSHRPGHPPYKAPKDIDGMYDDADVKKALPKNIDAWYGKSRQNVYQGFMMGSFYDQYRGYCETLTAMDRDIDRLLNVLDEMEIQDNTVVIYMGDNGQMWGQHDRVSIKEPYEESLKLPLIVRAPKLIKDPGTKREQMALNIDIAPTLLDMAGVPKPKDMDGESFVPILKSPAAKGRDAFLMEFWRYFPENTPSYVGVRTNRYKFVEYERGRDPLLFDLKRDSAEQNNLYGTPEGDKLLPGLLAKMGKLNKNQVKFK